VLTCALLLAVTPLGLLIVAMLGRRWRRAHKVLALSLAAFGVWQLGTALIGPHAPYMYNFEFARGSDNFFLQASQLTRAQDWVLLEHDLALASAKREAPQLPRRPWYLNSSFLTSQRELTSPQDLELLQRYERISAIPRSPGMSLGECARSPGPPELRYARCAPGAASWWLHKPDR